MSYTPSAPQDSEYNFEVKQELLQLEEEKQRFLKIYREALAKREIEWLEREMMNSN